MPHHVSSGAARPSFNADSSINSYYGGNNDNSYSLNLQENHDFKEDSRLKKPQESKVHPYSNARIAAGSRTRGPLNIMRLNDQFDDQDER